MRITKKQKLESIRENYKLHNVYTIHDIKNNHKGYFFSPDTIRFWKSRICGEVFCSKTLCFFVTSEQFLNEGRKFTVRRYNPTTKSIDTVGEYHQLDTKTQALNIALELAYTNQGE